MSKKKSKIKYHKTNFHSLQYEVITIYKENSSIQEIITEASKEFPELATLTEEQCSNAGAMTVSSINGRSIYVIFNNEVTDDILAHECIHITSFSFYLVQTSHNEHTEEIYAYSFQSIYNEIKDILLYEFKIDKELFFDIKKENLTIEDINS